MTRKILVVEDSPTQAELIRLLLEGAGYQVELAANGRAGIEKVDAAPPDLIISDVMMPEMDGYAFCQAVKSAERTRRIPFVLLTQCNTPQDILWGLTLGADNFIAKPFEDASLLERVGRIFEHLDFRQRGQLEVEVTLRVGDQEIRITPDKQQIIELLFATFEDVCRLNNALHEAKRTLEDYACNLEAKVQERTADLRSVNATLQAEITERRRAEELLHLQATVLEAAANAIVITDRDGRIAWVNPAYTQLTGYTLGEAQGQNPRLLKSGRHEDSFYRTMWNTILSGRVWSGEIVNRRKDGSLYTEEMTITPVRTERGEISHFIGIKQDITERKQAAEALAARTLQLEAVRAVTAEITQELDLSVLLRLINRRATELVGAASGTLLLWDEPAEVLIPRAWHGHSDWIGELRYRPGEGLAGTVAERREGILVNDYRAYERAHPAILKHSAVTAVIGEPLLHRNRLLGVITVNHEGSGRTFTADDRNLLALFASQAAIAIEKARLYQEVQHHASQLEVRVQERTRELEAANQQLEAASRHKSEFLANMSHELRTPLNSILGFAQILLEQTKTLLSEKQRRYLTHIYSSGQHLLQLINDILDLSKVEAGKIVLQPERLPVMETLEDILVIARGLAHKKGQRIEAAIAPDLPVLRADPVRFKQILFNLLSNAVKFTPDGGTVTVRAYQQAENSRQPAAGSGQKPAPSEDLPLLAAGCPLPALVLEVTDSGIGIKAEDLPRLFQEFVQLEAATTKQHEGTGLGLALTKRLVELHGGRIRATSEGEGRGSSFCVLLPFAGGAS